MAKTDPRLKHVYERYPQDPQPAPEIRERLARTLVNWTDLRHKLQLKPLKPVYVQLPVPLAYIVGSTPQPLLLVDAPRFAAVYTQSPNQRPDWAIGCLLLVAYLDAQQLDRPELWMSVCDLVFCGYRTPSKAARAIKHWARLQPKRDPTEGFISVIGIEAEESSAKPD